MRVRRFSTDISIGDAQVPWGGYMGTNGDGLFSSGFTPPVGAVSDFIQKATLRVIPNPFNDKVTVQADFAVGDYMLTDVVGRSVVSGTFDREIDFTSFDGPSGVYLLHLRPTGLGTTSVVRVVHAH